MDCIEACNIEFLDFSEVDDEEKRRVLFSLHTINPSVQLPWDSVAAPTNSFHVENLNNNNKSQHNKNTSAKSVAAAAASISFNNNNRTDYDEQQQFHHQQQQHYHQPPLNSTIYSSAPPHSHHHHQQAVNYTNQQQYVIYSPTILTPPNYPLPHHNQYAPPYSPTTIIETVPSYNSVNNYVAAAADDYYIDAGADDTNYVVDAPQESLDDETVVILEGNNDGGGGVAPPISIDQDQQVNGETQQVEESSSSSSRKSWASLFNKPKTLGDASNIVPAMNGAVSKAVFTPGAATRASINANDGLCPIRHPRKSVFIDPNCYRMGEFLLAYTLDIRTISLQPRGLINRSNYCYINSILQALLACPPVYNLLCGLANSYKINEKKKPSTPFIDAMCRFVNEFQHLPAALRVGRRSGGGTGDGANNHQKKSDQGGGNSGNSNAALLINCDPPFEPAWIYRMLSGVRTDSFLVEGRQEDAEEFLGCVLNGLNDEILDLIKLLKRNDGDGGDGDDNNSVGDGVLVNQNQLQIKNSANSNQVVSSTLDLDSDKEWQVMGPKNKGSVTRRTEFGQTPISDIFGGLIKSRIHRSGDQHTHTDNIQPFFTLQLNIEKVTSVREALEALVSKNQIEGMTSHTNEQVEAWQQVSLEELPVILVLHLKCFDFKLDGCTKIMKALEFPIDLKINSKWMSSKISNQKEKWYKLFAVVYHDGKEASKGHYLTDAYHVGYGSWLRYDDASVKAVQEEHVLKPQGTRVPYLLFYRRRNF